MSKLVAFANAKGGVGKTTVALSMAETSAHLGKRVLLIDLDLQINASMTIAGDCDDDLLPWRRAQTIEDYLGARWSRFTPNPMQYVDQSKSVHLLSGSPNIAFFERRILVTSENVFEARNCINAWMNDIISRARETYDLIVCDTPPGLSLLAEAALRSADLIVVPQVPDRLSTQGLQRYRMYVEEDLQLYDAAQKTAVFINMYNGVTNVARVYANAIRREAQSADFPYRVFRNHFKAKVNFKEAVDISRQQSFDVIWAGLQTEVLAATGELWNFLGWQLEAKP